MPQAIIVHGTYGNPNENWFPWLKTELEIAGYNVNIPAFPTPENQSLEAWLDVYRDINTNSSTIFVGHSLGVAFILNILESLDLPVRAVFLVSGFLGLLNNEEFDRLNKEFIGRKFNWEKIRKNAGKIFLYHSNNDPYVPTEKAYELADHLGVEPTIIENAGHFNEQAGYIEFPKLLADMKSIS